MKKMHRAMIKISTLSALYTSAALTAALTQRWFQILFALFGVYNIYVFWEDYLTLPNFGRHEVSLFKFTPLELRGARVSEQPVINDLGLLYDGCKVSKDTHNVTALGSSVLLSFQQPQVMNGFYFRTLATTPELDPVRFKMEGSMNGESWRAVGGSGTMQVLIRGLPIVGSWSPTTTERLAEQTFDQRAAWQNELYSLSATLIYSIGFLIVAGLAARGSPERGKIALVTTLACEAVHTFTCAIIFVASGRTLESVDAWLRFFIYITVSLSLALREQHIIKDMFFFGVSLVLLPWIQASTYNGNPLSGVTKLPPIGIAITAITLIIALCRVFLLYRAEKTIRCDMDAYNSVWEQTWNKEGTQQAVADLSTLCKQLRLNAPRTVLQQCNKLTVSHFNGGAVALDIGSIFSHNGRLSSRALTKAVLNYSSPISSLDQVHNFEHTLLARANTAYLCMHSRYYTDDFIRTHYTAAVVTAVKTSPQIPGFPIRRIEI